MITFEQLYEKRADYVYFLCTRLEVEEERIQRLNTDVWRRIRRLIPQLQGESEERWLCTKIVETHRSLQRHFRDDSDQIDRSANSPEARLRYALMKLGVEYRWPLVFRECAGFAYRELASILGVPEGTVRARLGRGRALLRRFQEVPS